MNNNSELCFVLDNTIKMTGEVKRAQLYHHFYYKICISLTISLDLLFTVLIFSILLPHTLTAI